MGWKREENTGKEYGSDSSCKLSRLEKLEDIDDRLATDGTAASRFLDLHCAVIAHRMTAVVDSRVHNGIDADRTVVTVGGRFRRRR